MTPDPKKLMEQIATDVMQNRARITDEFMKAYIATEIKDPMTLKAGDVEMVCDFSDPTKQVIFFRHRDVEKRFEQATREQLQRERREGQMDILKAINEEILEGERNMQSRDLTLILSVVKKLMNELYERFIYPNKG